MTTSIKFYNINDVKSEVEELYSEWGYCNPVSDKDLILLARHDENPVGVVRLCFEEKTYVLRGMFVKTRYQDQGLGSQILNEFKKKLVAENISRCFLICAKGLDRFYTKIGFQIAEPSIEPLILQARRSKYTQQHGPQIIMVLENS